ncbi:MAG TPA: ribosome assembly RNA-binding protein YhbY [Candidatus Ligilactobacillus excrementigallinarum]|uniref:Ribosome assembly RNA-binding protein YhbY n=1 Tax=Candidatus Ligilactobacillus excrementigallinarum TaxID=2838641 RepID=A0A9D1UXP9_9LACO|nr:ribosome assembly RNA-binding protein YhbY [Candidatus Ligilactobacillus excrementigallinarum]
MKLRGKQKRFLRSQAHSMKPIFQIGKEGINQQWLNEVSDALEKRELIKVNILNNSLLEPAEVEEYIQENSNIQVIQKIGHVLVLFKRSNNKNYREISNQVAKI